MTAEKISSEAKIQERIVETLDEIDQIPSTEIELSTMIIKQLGNSHKIHSINKGISSVNDLESLRKLSDIEYKEQLRNQIQDL